jgi:hypothetical protein
LRLCPRPGSLHIFRRLSFEPHRNFNTPLFRTSGRSIDRSIGGKQKQKAPAVKRKRSSASSGRSGSPLMADCQTHRPTASAMIGAGREDEECSARRMGMGDGTTCEGSKGGGSGQPCSMPTNMLQPVHRFWSPAQPHLQSARSIALVDFFPAATDALRHPGLHRRCQLTSII